MKRIFHAVDMQAGFMDPKAEELYVEGSQSLIYKIESFMRRTQKGMFDQAIFTYDTHFWFEYNASSESDLFPNIHCEYGQKGWGLVVNPSLLRGKTDVHFVSKNEFDFWGANQLTNRIDILPHLFDVPPLYLSNEYLDGLGFSVEEQFGYTREEFEKTVAKRLPKNTVIKVVSIADIGKEGEYNGEKVFVCKDRQGNPAILACVDHTTVKAYKNLFKLSKDLNCLVSGVKRDDFLKNVDEKTQVVIAGVASDYCVQQALLGYLKKGCQVVVLEDLVKGIVDDMKTVLTRTEFQPYQSQVTLMKSMDYLKNTTTLKPKPPKPPKPLI